MPSFEIMSTIVRRGLSGVLYPLRNTAVDPTSANWRSNNPNYQFVPNVGITTVGPITNASSMFANNTTFNDADIATWNTSTFTNMSFMFSGCSIFNQSLNSWDVANVTNMSNMFSFCTNFNGNVSAWNVANVTNMSGLFAFCTNFNQNISAWNVANVTNMLQTFISAQVFNQNISAWNVANVTTMDGLFSGANAFNCGQASGVAHNLMQRTATGGWRVNNVTNMNSMFNFCSAFNGNISAWCVNRIATVPTNFATSANVNWVVSRQPTWGQCPIP